MGYYQRTKTIKQVEWRKAVEHMAKEKERCHKDGALFLCPKEPVLPAFKQKTSPARARITTTRFLEEKKMTLTRWRPKFQGKLRGSSSAWTRGGERGVGIWPSGPSSLGLADRWTSLGPRETLGVPSWGVGGPARAAPPRREPRQPGGAGLRCVFSPSAVQAAGARRPPAGLPWFPWVTWGRARAPSRVQRWGGGGAARAGERSGRGRSGRSRRCSQPSPGRACSAAAAARNSRAPGAAGRASLAAGAQCAALAAGSPASVRLRSLGRRWARGRFSEGARAAPGRPPAGEAG